MWQRIRTAIVLVVIVGFALFASDAPIFIVPLLAIGAFLAAYEWTRLMPRVMPAIGFALIALAVTLAALWLPASWTLWWAMSSLLWLCALYWVLTYPRQTPWYGKGLSLIGVILLTAAMTAMYALWQLSAWWLLYVFLLVWCADSGAYFVGRKLGKRKLAPAVSPNKSIEGLIGGVLAAAAVAVAVGVYLSLSGVSLLLFLLLSMLVVVASVLGDLFESMLKRKADIKDSGNILPGHGGILDRTDSLLSAVPIFALGLYLLAAFGVFDDTWLSAHSLAPLVSMRTQLLTLP